jgi:hypothetical protein
MNNRTIAFTFGKKQFRRALKRENSVFVLISLDPKSRAYRFSSGSLSPVALSDWHDDIDSEICVDELDEHDSIEE